MLKVVCFGFGGLVDLIDKFFQAIWTVIRRLSLQPLLTVAVVFAIVAACLPRDKITVELLTAFAVMGGMSLLYAIIATAYNVSRYLKAENKKSKKKKLEVDVDDIISERSITEPQFYRVAQNPRYVMAEYPDRYELYYDDNGDYKFVKVTLKNKRSEENND